MSQEYEHPDEEPSSHHVYKTNKDKYRPLYETIGNKKICVRKVKKGDQPTYKLCGRELFVCDWCKESLCPSVQCMWQYMIRVNKFIFPLKNHDKCLECDRITCRVHGLCEDCERHHDYDMITNDIAIGNFRASYEPFDIVVDLNFPRNKVERDQVVVEHITVGSKTVQVIRCGYSDDEQGLSKQKINDLLQQIKTFVNEINQPKILFHCYAGISRSTTIAIAYLRERDQQSAKQIFHRILQKRPRIDPNFHFRKLMGVD